MSQPAGRRVYCGKDEIPKVLNGLGITIVSTSEGRDDRQRLPAPRGGRRDPVQRLVMADGGEESHVPNWKNADRNRVRREGEHQRPTVSVKGPKGALEQSLPEGISVEIEGSTALVWRVATTASVSERCTGWLAR